MKSHRNLKSIRFDGQLLPKWAQLLDLASSLCGSTQDMGLWIAAFTNKNGVSDALTILAMCHGLRNQLLAKKDQVVAELLLGENHEQAEQIYKAWIYSLDTIVQQADGKRTCSWIIEDQKENNDDAFGGGEISLRRV